MLENLKQTERNFKTNEAYLKSHHPEITKIGVLRCIRQDLFLCKATRTHIMRVFSPTWFPPARCLLQMAFCT